MIDRREILEAASSFSLLPNIVEKDYVLGWMLAGINAHDELQGRKLTSGTQKHGVKDLFPVVPRRLAAIGQSAHFCGEIKHLVQIGFESVPARGYDFSFSFKKRRRLMRQIVAAAASKRCRNWIFSRTWSTKACRMWQVLGLPSTRTEICDWVCRSFPSPPRHSR